jgi:ABC-type dipeptide/oligopeptide/nickel transport system permease component
MVNFFQNLFEYGPILLVLCLPFLFSSWIAYRSSSWRRLVAVLLALFAGLIFAIETYSLLQKGNLTALLTMLSTPIVLVCILVLVIAEGTAKRIRSRDSIEITSEPDIATKKEDASA